MRRCDVLIVGGGPAGSSCALALLPAGLDVVVLDRERFPRDKVCAGWITPQILDELAVDPAEYGRGRVLQPIRGFRFGRMGDREVRVDYPEVVSYGIRRCELDHYLLERCGAELRLGEPLESLERHDTGWTVNGTLEASVVVGAGGHFCPVARGLGARVGRGEPLVVAREVEFEMAPRQRADCPVAPEVPELFFTPDLRGYGWIFRKGDHLNVGLGRQDPERFPAHLEAFIEFLERGARLPPDVPRRLRGHAYLLYGQAPRPLVGDRALLVGDAAGLAYPRSGEGIRPAVESGLLAGRAIAAAGGAYTSERLETYAAAMRARFGSREARGAGPTAWLPERWRAPLAGRLLTQPWFARRIVMDRWFLHRRHPGGLAPISPATSHPTTDPTQAKSVPVPCRRQEGTTATSV